MKDLIDYMISESDVAYVIRHKKTKQVLNTHSDYETAKDEWNGLGSDKSDYGIFKQSKKDAALRHRNQGTSLRESPLLGRGMSDAARSRDIDQSDKEYIEQRNFKNDWKRNNPGKVWPRS